MSTNTRRAKAILIAVFSLALSLTLPVLTAAQEQPKLTVYQTTLEEPNQKTPEITTEQMQQIVATGSEPILDVRSAKEYSIAHIPGSINLYEREVELIIEMFPDPATRMVLYCNGPFCGKSKRVSATLVAKTGCQGLHERAALPTGDAGLAGARQHRANRL